MGALGVKTRSLGIILLARLYSSLVIEERLLKAVSKEKRISLKRRYAEAIKREHGRVKSIISEVEESAPRVLKILLSNIDFNEICDPNFNALEVVSSLKRAVERTLIQVKYRVISRKIGCTGDLEELILSPLEVYLNDDFEYIRGVNSVLLVAPHAAPPLADRKTGVIVRRVCRITGSHGLISHCSRTIIDMNRRAARDTLFRRKLEELVNSGEVRVVLDIHSKRESENKVSIGTICGMTVGEEAVKIVINSFKTERIRIEVDVEEFLGGDIIWYHSRIPGVQAVQIELPRLRGKEQLKRVVKALSKAVVDLEDLVRRIGY